MADDPFADIGEISGGAMPPPMTTPTPSAAPDPNDPFASFGTAEEPVSRLQALGRVAGRGVLPSVAGVLGGAAAGSLAGPFGTLAGAGAALIGGGLAGYGAERAQAYGLSQMPEDWQESIGQSERQQRLAQEQHPDVSFLGGLAPFALTMRPWAGAATALPANATNLERLLANPLSARLFSGAVMGGVQTAQDVYAGDFSPLRTATATGFGLIFSHPTDFGRTLERAGGRLGEAFWRSAPEQPTYIAPEVSHFYESALRQGLTPEGYEALSGAFVHPLELEQVDQTAHQAERLGQIPAGFPTPSGESLYGEPIPPHLTTPASRPFAEEGAPGHIFDAIDQGEDVENNWTLADLWDGGIVGPGVNEETALGEVERDPTSVRQANEAAQTVAPPQRPDPDVEARRAEPELFADYDRARNSVDVLRAEIQRVGAPNVTAVQELEGKVAALQARLPRQDEYQGGRENRRIRAELRDAQRQLQETTARREAFAAGEAQDTPELAALRASLLRADEELRDVSRRVASARRAAAERVGSPIIKRAMLEESATNTSEAPAPPIARPSAPQPAPASIKTKEPAQEPPRTFEPIAPVPMREEVRPSAPVQRPTARNEKGSGGAEPPTGAAQPLSTEAQRAAIIDEATRMLVGAGRPEAEARAFAEIVAERYVTRAARFRGALGSALDLFRGAARVRGARGGAREPPGGRELNQTEITYKNERLADQERFSAPVTNDNRSDYQRALDQIPAPLSRRDRDWRNYGRHMTPDEVLDSEVVWSNAALGEAEGHDKAQAFADAANDIWSRMDANRYMTREMARRYMNVAEARARGIRTLEQGSRSIKKGSATFFAGRAPLIKLFKSADASTIVHEWGGHVWLEELRADAEHPAAPDVLRRDWETVRRWLGLKPGEDVTSNTEAHEKFATGFEQYVREGVTPSARLARIFEQFGQWLTHIYQTIKGLGEPINDEVRGVFERMIAERPEYVTIARERPTGGKMWNVHSGEATTAEAPDAEALADRAAAERMHAAPETPEAAHEIQEASSEVERQRAETSAGGAGAQPAGEAGPGAAGPRALEPGVAAAGNESERGGVGGGAGAQRLGGEPAAAEGAGVGPGEPAARSGAGPESFPLATRSKSGDAPELTHWIGKYDNIRLENVLTEQNARDAIQAVVDRKNSTAEVYTDSQRVRDAEHLGLDPRAFTLDHFQQMFGGLRMMPSKIEALINMFDQQSKAFTTLRATAAETLTDEDTLAAAEAGEKLLMFSNMLSPITSESGRALRSFQRRGAIQASNNAEMARQMTGKTLYQLKMEMILSKNLNSPARINKWIRDSQQRSFGRMMLEYFVNNLISGVPTHVTYVTGGQILLLNKMVVETAVASLIGRVRNELFKSDIGFIKGLGHEGSSVHIGEVWAQLQEYHNALPKALQAAIEAARTGLTTSLPGEAAHPQRVLQGDVGITPELQKQYDRWWLDRRMENPAKDKAEETRRAKEVERLKDVQPLAPFGDEQAMIRVSQNLANADVTWQEAQGDLFGLGRGIRDGMLSWGRLAASLGDPNAPAASLQFAPGRQIPDVALRGVSVPIGAMVNLPSRAVAMLHSGQRTMTYSTHLNGEAYRTAVDEGLTGDARSARIAYLRQNPTQEMMERAHQEANQITLMDQGGVLAKQMARLMDYAPKLPFIGETPIFRFIEPFVKVAANVMDRTLVQRTPLGLLSPSIRDALLSKDNVLADTTAARMLMGSVYAVGFGFLAAEGYVTGTGPIDPGRRQVWRMAGYQAHSVRIGDMWYDVHRLGPLGLLLGIGADMYDVGHIAKQGEFATAAAMFNHAIVQNLLDESFLRGPAELVDAIEHPQERGESYIQSLVSNFVPMSVGLSYMARAADPYSRMTRSVVSALKARIPGVSETLLPRVDLWGNDVPNDPALGGRGLTAVYMREMSNDPVNIALDQAGVAIASPRQFIAGVQLTDQQYHEFARAAGVMTHQRLNEWVLSPDWRAMTDDVKRQTVAEIVQQSRNAARGLMQMRYPELIARAADVKANRFQERF